jgi:hypothetical protein
VGEDERLILLTWIFEKSVARMGAALCRLIWKGFVMMVMNLMVA